MPKGRERNSFRAFADLKRSERSEFLDEVLGAILGVLRRRSPKPRSRVRPQGLRYHRIRGAGSSDRPPRFPTARPAPTGRLPRLRATRKATARCCRTLAANPLPIIIPCHRVVTTKSGAGSYIAGVKKKGLASPPRAADRRSRGFLADWNPGLDRLSDRAHRQAPQKHPALQVCNRVARLRPGVYPPRRSNPRAVTRAPRPSRGRRPSRYTEASAG